MLRIYKTPAIFNDISYEDLAQIVSKFKPYFKTSRSISVPVSL